jgi:hypothetical protein
MSQFGRVCVAVVFFLIIGLAAISVLGQKASGTFTSVGGTIGADHAVDAAKDGAPDQPKPPPVEETPRRIIYTASATLVVEDFDRSDENLRGLIKEHANVFISHSKVNGSRGSPRSGSWTIRVPADQLEAFFDEVGKLGEVHERALDSQDITEQYHDRESRLKNKVARQEALRQMLKESTAKKEDYLAVDRELNQVTQDIEADLGQLRLWRSLSDLATVHLTVRERKDYVPPTAPAFGTTIGRTFSGSVDLLVSLGKGVVLVVVALVPWLPVMAAFVPVWLLIKRAVTVKSTT